MRLVNVHTLQLETFTDEAEAKYAILSHRWEDGEVTQQEFERASPIDVSKPGYIKIQKFCQVAANDGHNYVWVDTCCIDKSSSAELSEAINSMFRWYENASVCYAFLSDVSQRNSQSRTHQKEFQASQWFTRGWTLQELLAPALLIFLDRDWKLLGTKKDLVHSVSEITEIPVEVLEGRNRFDEYCVAQRMVWASKRRTTRIEDIAYSLMGLFNVNMPMLYGEGDRAFARLQMTIIQQEHDHSIFAWSTRDPVDGGLLAKHPSAFRMCRDMVGYGTDPARGVTPQDYKPIPIGITSRGIELTSLGFTGYTDVYLVALNCANLSRYSNNQACQPFIVLERMRNPDQYARANGEIFFRDSESFPSESNHLERLFRIPQPLSSARRGRYEPLKNAICVTFATQESQLQDCKSDQKIKIISDCAQSGDLWLLDCQSKHGSTFDAVVDDLIVRVKIAFVDFDMYCAVNISSAPAVLGIETVTGVGALKIHGLQISVGPPGTEMKIPAQNVYPTLHRGEAGEMEEPGHKAFWTFAADRFADCTVHLELYKCLESAAKIKIVRLENAEGKLVWHVHVSEIKSEAIKKRFDANHSTDEQMKAKVERLKSKAKDISRR